MKKIIGKAAVILIALWFLAGCVFWLRSDPKTWLLLSEFAFNAVVVAMMFGAAWVVGDFIKGLLGEKSEGLEGFLTATGLGLGADAVFLFALGALGLLYKPIIIAMIGLPLIFSTNRIRNYIESKSYYRELGAIQFSAVEWMGIFSFVVVGAFVFLGAIQPEVFYDALYYHDAFPSLYLIRHKIEVFPHAVHSLMPFYTDLLYMIPLSFAEAGSVKLTHLLFFVGSTLWIYSLGKRLFDRESAIIGCAVWATIPGVHWIASMGANDMGVSFFGLGAISLVLRWVFKKEGQETLIASAIFLGIAVGSKYTALMIGMVCAGMVLAGAYKRRMESGPRRAIMAVVIFGVISIAIASPWYIRNTVAMGNPLYPEFSTIGSPGYNAYQNLRKDSPRPYPVLQTFGKLPVDLWQKTNGFGAVTLLGLGVFAFVPALFWGFWRRGPARWIGIIALTLYILWSRSVLILRYLYPGMALFSILAGGMLAGYGTARKFPKILVCFFLALAIFYDFKHTLAYYVSSPIGPIRFLAAPQSEEELLGKYVPHTLSAKFVRDNLPSDIMLLMAGETQGYYFHRNYMPISYFDRHPLQDWIKSSNSAEELKAILKKQGITHILWCEHEWTVMNRTYGYLTLDERGWQLFHETLGGLKQVYKDRYYEIYEL